MRPTMTARSARARIRLLAIIEGDTVSGPAKNLLEFYRISRDLEDGPIVEMSLLLFQRLERGAKATRPGSNELLQQALREGIPVHCIPERFTFDWRVIATLKKIVDRVAPDIIQTHMFKSHFLVRACGAHNNRAWVAFHHGYTTSTLRRGLLTQLDRWSLQAPSQVVAVSRAFARLLSSRGVSSSRIMVLHNAIASDWLACESDGQDSCPKQSAPIVSPHERLVIAVGRLSKEKAFPDLVAAIHYLREMQPKLAVRLVIVGEGRERKTIEEAIRRAGLEQQVSLPGHVRDVRPYYRAADLLVISSLSEGSPNALLEAMAAAVPVVSTAVGGIREIVSHGETAFLVPPGDHVAMAKAIEQLLSNRDLAEKMTSRARELIRTRYSPMSRTKSLINLYERLCSTTGGMHTSGLSRIADSSHIFAEDDCAINLIRRSEGQNH